MNDHKVPVFVSPQSLIFSLDDKTSHRQIITLFNPYDFPVRFKGKLKHLIIYDINFLYTSICMYILMYLIFLSVLYLH